MTVPERRLKPAAPQPSWQQALREAFRDGRQLLEYLELTPAAVGYSAAAQDSFPCLVPRPFAERMTKGNPHDPLLLQVLPQALETDDHPDFGVDPLAEQDACLGDGVLHKYPGRALIIATGACPVHCRYCFRRHFPYQTHQATPHDWRRALTSLAASEPLHEVILSGGDPLTLSNRRLEVGFKAFETLPQLQTVRLHTRFPIILPARVDPALTALLKRSQARVVMVVHVNHPDEIDSPVIEALAALRTAGVTLLNQSVLLRGVNDDPGTLAALSETLFAAGILPYYLHLLDPVAGAAHFQVRAERGRQLIRAMRGRLPGYLVPRLAREIPGESSKSVLA